MKIKTQFTDIYNSQSIAVSTEHAYDTFPIIKICSFVKQKFVTGARSEAIRRQWAVRNQRLENMS